jgi:hypothetical protein
MKPKVVDANVVDSNRREWKRFVSAIPAAKITFRLRLSASTNNKRNDVACTRRRTSWSQTGENQLRLAATLPWTFELGHSRGWKEVDGRQQQPTTGNNNLISKSLAQW